MALIDLQRAVQGLCLAPDAQAVAPASVERPEVWLLYRRMVRKRLLGELRVALRRTFVVAGEPRMRAALEAQLAKSPPRTRRFYEVPGAFAAATVPAWRNDPELPAHLADLLEYEAALWEVGDLDDRVGAEVDEFAFDRPVMLASALRLLEVGHRVHRRGEEHVGELTRLLVCRRATDKRGRTWVLNAISYALMQRLLSGSTTPADAIRGLAEERGFRIDEAFLDGLCTVLSSFIEAGVILGSRRL